MKSNKLIIAAIIIALIVVVYFNIKDNSIKVIERGKKFDKDVIEIKPVPKDTKPSPPIGSQRVEYHVVDYNNLYVGSYPSRIELHCSNQKSFVIEIGNNGNSLITDINFSVYNNKNLLFIFPENIVIPPNNVKEISVFVTADCSENYYDEVNPRITIADMASINLNVIVDKRLE